MRIILALLIVIFFSQCSIIREKNNQCSEGLLKVVQFNNLIELGITEDTIVYNVVDLRTFFQIDDSITAKNEWNRLIKDTRFLESNKSTLRETYLNNTCQCSKTRDTILIRLDNFDDNGKLYLVERFKLLNRNRSLILIDKKNERK